MNDKRNVMTFRSSQRPRSSSMLIALALGVLFLHASRTPLAASPGDGPRSCAPRSEPGQTAIISEASGRPASADTASTDAAFDFLAAQMDRYHQSTLVYSEYGFGAYHPGGRMGDADDISVVPLGERGDPVGGASLEIDYHPPSSGGLGWAGLYFLYPDGNWGQFPGRNLVGATRLTFWACADHDTRAEFFVGGVRDPRLPYADSMPKASTGSVAVTTAWQRYEINLDGKDLSSVIGGFGVTMGRSEDPHPRSLVLADIAFDLPSLGEPRFLPSDYPQGTCRIGVLRNSAQVYDQALVLLALLARRGPDDLRRAELIARAFVEAQHKDRTFKDGRLRNAYAGGELIDPHLGTTRLPGVYDAAAHKFLEDENVAGTDTGDMAWAGLALVQAHSVLPKHAGNPYLAAAVSLARWIVKNTRVKDALGGFSAGVQGFERAAGVPEGQLRKTYRSTEHNIDLAALFTHLAAAVADPEESRRWSAEATHAREFVARMRADGGEAPFWTGTGAGTTINKGIIPLDVQTWGVLGTREPSPYAGTLDWALNHCTEAGTSDAFDFDCRDRNGAWWEGTAQVAAALKWLRRGRDAAPILARLRGAQLKTGPAAGALPAASLCGLPTGFDRISYNGKVVPQRYSNWPHIGATAWFIFAALGVDPYFVVDPAASRSR